MKSTTQIIEKEGGWLLKNVFLDVIKAILRILRRFRHKKGFILTHPPSFYAFYAPYRVVVAVLQHGLAPLGSMICIFMTALI